MCAAVLGLWTAACVPAAIASETKVPLLTPGKGGSFNVGSKRAVGYFLNDNGTCKVTVVLAEATGDGATPAPPATRVNVSVAPGKSARIDAGGKALEFVCRASAATMTVRALEETEFARRS